MLKKQKNKWVLVKRTKLAFSYPCILESVGMEEETSFYIPAASKQTRRAKTNPRSPKTNCVHHLIMLYFIYVEKQSEE